MAEVGGLVASLIRLGFTQYEAQAYTALAGQRGLTGAEVGRRAKMPASKVYETLARLETRGAVLVNRSEPVRYSAIAPADLLDQLRTSFDSDLAEAEAALSNLPSEHEPGVVWSLSGRESILQAFSRAIASARESIFAGIWDEELDVLGPLLEAASARGVETHVAMYGSGSLDGAHVYDMSSCGASARLRLSGRRLAVINVDDTEVVAAEFGHRSPDQATVTNNPVIALLAAEYIKADVSGRLLIAAMPPSRLEDLLKTEPMKTISRPVPPRSDSPHSD